MAKQLSRRPSVDRAISPLGWRLTGGPLWVVFAVVVVINLGSVWFEARNSSIQSRAQLANTSVQSLMPLYLPVLALLPFVWGWARALSGRGLVAARTRVSIEALVRAGALRSMISAALLTGSVVVGSMVLAYHVTPVLFSNDFFAGGAVYDKLPVELERQAMARRPLFGELGAISPWLFFFGRGLWTGLWAGLWAAIGFVAVSLIPRPMIALALAPVAYITLSFGLSMTLRVGGPVQWAFPGAGGSPSWGVMVAVTVLAFLVVAGLLRLLARRVRRGEVEGLA